MQDTAPPNELDVTGWPAIRVPAFMDAPWVSSLLHVCTVVDQVDDDAGLYTGYTTWAAEFIDSRIGMTWRWSRDPVGLVSLANPMEIDSNAMFITADGTFMGESMRIVRLNDIVYSLPWQDQVQFLANPPMRHRTERGNKRLGLHFTTDWEAARPSHTLG